MTDEEKLEEICDENIECTCDMCSPWNRCRRCMAAGTLNMMAEIAREGLEEIKVKR